MSLRTCAIVLKPTRGHIVLPAISISRVRHGAFRHHCTTFGYRSRTASPIHVIRRGYLTPTREEVTGTLVANRNKLVNAIARKDTDDICFYYEALRDLILDLPSLLKEECDERLYKLELIDFSEATRLLVEQKSKRCADVVLLMIDDCEALHGVKVNNILLNNALRALLVTSQPLEAYHLILRFHRSKTSIKPNSEHWRLVLQGLGSIRDILRMKSCINIMKSSWPYPNPEHFRQLLTALLYNLTPPPIDETIDEISSILEEMRGLNIPYESRTYSLLELASVFDARCRILAQEYKKRQKALARTDRRSHLWLTILAKARKEGSHSFFEQLRTVRKEGFIPNERSLSKLLDMDDSTSVEQLDFFSDALEVTSNVFDWGVLIRNAVSKLGPTMALNVYEEAKRRNITPNTPMVHPLLSALCDGSLKEPEEHDINRALEIYQDLKDAALHNSSEHVLQTPIFNTLLRALSTSSAKSKYFPVAISLLQDMSRFHVSSDSMTEGMTTILVMRSASNFEEAIRAYRLVRARGKNNFDSRDFIAILKTYCNLDFGEFTFPPPEGYLQIIKDMQEDGVPRDVGIYIVLLSRHAGLATRINKMEWNFATREALLLRLSRIIQEIHRMLSVDASITPNIVLLNQLMDTYNRVGHFDGVMQTWAMIQSIGVHNASVSIVLDACGFGGAYEQASRIWKGLNASNFPLNTNNWHSWIECLCRLGRLDEAITTLCLDMAKEGSGVTPEEMSVKIIVTFARSMKRVEDVRQRLEVHLPDFYNSLPPDIWN